MKKLIVDRYALKEMFRMSVEFFETVLKHITNTRSDDTVLSAF